jgi:hypothetical protein
MTHNATTGQPGKSDTTTQQDYCKTPVGKWVMVVKDYVKQLEYGEVVIRIHGGKVVQVHKTEKIQF